MTREELEKEAEENSFRYTLDKPWACEVERKQIMVHFEKGYLASAEPREKQIAELEEENRYLRDEIEDLTAYCDQIGKIKTGVLKLFEHIVAK